MSTTSWNVAGSNGSRSKTAQSGSSGASMRECHGCRSMTPALATHASVATSLTTMYVLVFSPWYVHELDPRGSVRRFVLAPERLSIDAVGKDLHRKRAVSKVRQHVRRHADVVLDHVALGDAVGGPQHLVQVGERESAAGYLPSCVAVERSQLGERLRRMILRVLSPRGPLVPRGDASPRCTTRRSRILGRADNARCSARRAPAFRILVACRPGSVGRLRRRALRVAASFAGCAFVLC